MAIHSELIFQTPNLNEILFGLETILHHGNPIYHSKPVSSQDASANCLQFGVQNTLEELWHGPRTLKDLSSSCMLRIEAFDSKSSRLLDKFFLVKLIPIIVTIRYSEMFGRESCLCVRKNLRKG